MITSHHFENTRRREIVKSKSPSPYTIVVTGDVLTNYVFTCNPGPAAETRLEFRVQNGGAWLILDLIRAAIAGQNDVTVESDPAPPAPGGSFPGTCLGSEGLDHMVVRLDSFPSSSPATRGHDKDEGKVYRIGSIVGVEHGNTVVPGAVGPASGMGGSLDADLLVLCDSRAFFRASDADRASRRSAVIDHLARYNPDAGKLSVIWHWTNHRDLESVLEPVLRELGLLDSTIALTEADSLREAGVTLRGGSSYERIIEDFALELERVENGTETPNGLLARLLSCKHVIVRVGIDAALVVSRREPANGGLARRQLRMFFRAEPSEDYTHIEFGEMAGYNSVMTASIVKSLVEDRVPGLRPHRPAIVPSSGLPLRTIYQGVKQGLGRCLKHFQDGYGAAHGTPPPAPNREWPRALFDSANEPNAPRSIGIKRYKGIKRYNYKNNQHRTILLAAASRGEIPERIRTIASDIVVRGLQKAAQKWGFPVARFGDLYRVDRSEIESYLDIQIIMRKYVHGRAWNRPLCLAAFGPPGAGKSLGMRKIADSITSPDSRGRMKTMEFNMSQFGGVGDLVEAFHQAREAVLAGETPLVFLDEFDSPFDNQDFGWLKYLLSPMQDGTFRDRGKEYHIIRSILVFVGGLNGSFDEIRGRLRSPEFTKAKGPDFLSRLRGHINVVGPDPTPDAGQDPEYVIRRAVALRSLLEQKKSVLDIFDERKVARIEPALIEGFLYVNKYKHGVRSMEAIIEMSHVSPIWRSLRRASLPSEAQLEMHVDARDFVDCIVKGGATSGP